MLQGLSIWGPVDIAPSMPPRVYVTQYLGVMTPPVLDQRMRWFFHFKGQGHETFSTLFFPSKPIPQPPDSYPKIFEFEYYPAACPPPPREDLILRCCPPRGIEFCGVAPPQQTRTWNGMVTGTDTDSDTVHGHGHGNAHGHGQRHGFGQIHGLGQRHEFGNRHGHGH
jgi:hypothetical protein